MVMEAGNAHPEFARYIIDSERLVKAFAQAPDCFRNAASVSSRRQEMAEPAALLSLQEPVYNLANDERRQNLRPARPLTAFLQDCTIIREYRLTA